MLGRRLCSSRRATERRTNMQTRASHERVGPSTGRTSATYARYELYGGHVRSVRTLRTYDTYRIHTYTGERKEQVQAVGGIQKEFWIIHLMDK